MSARSSLQSIAVAVVTVALMATISIPAAANGGPQLVKDINTQGAGSAPGPIVDVGGTAYLFACDGSDNLVLWTSDGTPSGTHRIKDVGDCYDGRPDWVHAVMAGGRLFFVVNSQDHHLWTSDGTPAGTAELRTIEGGEIDPVEISLAALHGALYFTVASSQDTADGLWTSDGTRATTRLVKSILRPSGGIASAGGTLYFTSYDGRKLWKSDGTGAGTRLVKSLTGERHLEDLTAVGNKVFMVGLNGYSCDMCAATEGIPSELWVSDGTAAGTHRVKDIRPGHDDLVRALTAVGEILFFTARDASHGTELWRSDGTAAGTNLVRDIDPNGGSVPKDLVGAEGRLYFTASNGAHGRGLWTSDGTKAGTAQVGSILPTHYRYAPQEVAVGSRLYLGAKGKGGAELWMSDGTTAGTRRLANVMPGSEGSYPQALAEVGGRLFFSAVDGQHGRELWASDGTSAGTKLAADLNTASIDGVLPFDSGAPTAAGPLLFFPADDGMHGQELWVSDGSASGTQMVSDITVGPDSSWPFELTAVGSNVFFSAEGASEGGWNLWVSDGTETGTRRLESAFHSWPSNLTPFNGKLLFLTDRALWISDGTDEGTVPLATSLWGVHQLTRVGDAAYFTVGSQLWKTDGTPEGTVAVAPFDGFADLAAVGHRLYFSAGEDGPYELWTSDGTPEGTLMVKSIGPLAALTPVGDTLYFTVGEDEDQLWKSDGTAEGTTRIKALAGREIRSLTNVGEGLFFTTKRWDAGLKDYVTALWKSDGTKAGTVAIPGVKPDPEYAGLKDIAGTLYFCGRDGSHGWEPWTSDGSMDGTAMVADLDPNGSSGPTWFAKVGSSLFFAADDGVHGFELWTMPLP